MTNDLSAFWFCCCCCWSPSGPHSPLPSQRHRQRRSLLFFSNLFQLRSLCLFSSSSLPLLIFACMSPRCLFFFVARFSIASPLAPRRRCGRTRRTLRTPSSHLTAHTRRLLPAEVKRPGPYAPRHIYSQVRLPRLLGRGGRQRRLLDDAHGRVQRNLALGGRDRRAVKDVQTVRLRQYLHHDRRRGRRRRGLGERGEGRHAHAVRDRSYSLRCARSLSLSRRAETESSRERCGGGSYREAPRARARGFAWSWRWSLSRRATRRAPDARDCKGILSARSP